MMLFYPLKDPIFSEFSKKKFLHDVPRLLLPSNVDNVDSTIEQLVQSGDVDKILELFDKVDEKKGRILFESIPWYRFDIISQLYQVGNNIVTIHDYMKSGVAMELAIYYLYAAEISQYSRPLRLGLFDLYDQYSSFVHPKPTKEFLEFEVSFYNSENSKKFQEKCLFFQPKYEIRCKIGSASVVSDKQFLTQFHIFTCGVFKKILNWGHICVVGGAVSGS